MSLRSDVGKGPQTSKRSQLPVAPLELPKNQLPGRESLRMRESYFLARGAPFYVRTFSRAMALAESASIVVNGRTPVLRQL